MDGEREDRYVSRLIAISWRRLRISRCSVEREGECVYMRKCVCRADLYACVLNERVFLLFVFVRKGRVSVRAFLFKKSYFSKEQQFGCE